MSENYYEEEEFTTEFNSQTIWRIFKHGLVHWPLMLAFFIAICMVALIESYFTYISKQMIDEGILANDIPRLTSLAMQYGGLLFLFAGFVFMFIIAAGTLGHRVQYDLRQQMFERLQGLQLSYYDRTPTGWIMSRVTSDASRVGDLVSWGFLDMIWTVTSITASVVFMMIINWRMALMVLLIIPILWVVSIRFKQRILKEYRLVRKFNSKITSSYNENITGVRVVKSLRREEKNLSQFGGLTNNMYQASFKAAWLSALFLPIVQLISTAGVATVVWYGGYQVQIGGMTIGGIQAFVAYITFMLWPIQQMAIVYANMQQAVASAERIFSLLDTKSEIVDAPDATDPGTIRGDILFDHVTFQYEADKPVLTDFNLHVKQGETVALVGPTGAGKSTLVNLLCRFYEPVSGTIRYNGQDYKKMKLHAIHSRIGMVLQTPHLFSGSVLENLRYGNLDATDDQVVEASRMAGAHPFITDLDNGYETEVGEGGTLLSTGQKQLISLARAIMANPDIFIMDEATSSVDTLTEALIQQGMDKLMEGRTSFIIAHRLSTIKSADRILVIENGGVSEMGTHAELIRQRGHYYNLYTKQFRSERAKVYGLDDGIAGTAAAA
ncbi:MAG: ABC transporter ATP-binding protein [Chloroflexi bacterium]|nr:ABC transporter ATP-binding protein [Chloroflexota bacterium]